MNTLYTADDLSALNKEKILRYAKFKRMEAFQLALSEYRDTIGEWRITDFKDAGANWRQSSNLNCDCGRLLRYQYTVTNQVTLKTHRFGITHLKAESGFSDQTVNAITRSITNAEREIEEVEQRLLDNWTFNIQIPESIVLPNELQKLLDENIPFSSKEESLIINLIKKEQQKKWEKNKVGIPNIPLQHLNRQRRNSFELQDNEKSFINLLLKNGMGSAEAIAEELHSHVGYQDRYITGRSKLYLMCVFYLDELVNEKKLF